MKLNPCPQCKGKNWKETPAGLLECQSCSWTCLPSSVIGEAKLSTPSVDKEK